MKYKTVGTQLKFTNIRIAFIIEIILRYYFPYFKLIISSNRKIHNWYYEKRAYQKINFFSRARLIFDFMSSHRWFRFWCGYHEIIIILRFFSAVRILSHDFVHVMSVKKVRTKKIEQKNMFSMHTIEFWTLKSRIDINVSFVIEFVNFSFHFTIRAERTSTLINQPMNEKQMEDGRSIDAWKGVSVWLSVKWEYII